MVTLVSKGSKYKSYLEKFQFIVERLKGEFVVIEGIDGTGKSTLSTQLMYFFTDLGLPWYKHREPGGSNFGESIRNTIMEYGEGISDETTAMLMISSRRYNLDNHLGDVIKSKERIVISDRFDFSTLAYQCFSSLNTKSESTIDSLVIANELTYPSDDFRPSMYIVLSCSPKVAMERNNKENHFDKYTKEHFEALDIVYRGLVNSHETAQLLNVDGMSEEEVFYSSLDLIYERYFK